MRGTRTEILTCESICGLKTSFLHTALPEELEIPVSTCPYWRQLLSLLLSSHFHLNSSESISLSIPIFGTIQFPGFSMCKQKGSALFLSRSVGQSHQPASQRICAMMNVKTKQIACQEFPSLLQLSSNPVFIQHHFFRSWSMMTFNCLSSLVFLSPQASSLRN